MNTPDLQPLRQGIDGLDDALVAILTARVRLSRQAQGVKVRAGQRAFDPRREAAIILKYERANHGAGQVARAILDWCRA